MTLDRLGILLALAALERNLDRISGDISRVKTQKVARERAIKDVKIRAARESGETLRSIADRHGVTKEAVRQSILREERNWRRRGLIRRAHLAQPIDLGGPRDVWLTFLPGPDARFDFMEPSNGL